MAAKPRAPPYSASDLSVSTAGPKSPAVVPDVATAPGTLARTWVGATRLEPAIPGATARAGAVLADWLLGVFCGPRAGGDALGAVVLGPGCWVSWGWVAGGTVCCAAGCTGVLFFAPPEPLEFWPPAYPNLSFGSGMGAESMSLL